MCTSLHLNLGISKIDITPNHPIPLAGFTDREGESLGISHPLYARIFVFEQESLDGKESALVVSADLIWWGSERLTSIRQKIRERWGIDENSIILHATHTHSGPQTSDRFTPSLGLFDKDYLEMLEYRLMEGIAKAFTTIEPVLMESEKGKCHLGIYRRRKFGEEIRMAPNGEGPTDPEVNVIRFFSQEGKTKAIWVHYTCHPTTTGDNFISSEFPGVAMETVEKKLGGEVVAAYLQGCCGDIRPALIRDGEFFRGNDSHVKELGSELAQEVLYILRQPMKGLVPCKLSSTSLAVPLSFQQLPSVDQLKALSNEETLTGEWSERLLMEPERIQPTIPFELTWLKIANGLSLLAMNGEMVVGYGLFINSKFSGRVLPVAYSNGMIGYVPTARQVKEGGYEAKESTLYFALPAPFDSSVEEKIQSAILSLIGKESDNEY
jgi:hypothetical protein